jgi:hypothetical protein
MSTVEEEQRHYQSLGYLAATFQRPVADVIAAASSLGLEPSLTLNCTGYFARWQVELLRDQLRSGEATATEGVDP